MLYIYRVYSECALLFDTDDCSFESIMDIKRLYDYLESSGDCINISEDNGTTEFVYRHPLFRDIVRVYYNNGKYLLRSIPARNSCIQCGEHLLRVLNTLFVSRSRLDTMKPRLRLNKFSGHGLQTPMGELFLEGDFIKYPLWMWKDRVRIDGRGNMFTDDLRTVLCYPDKKRWEFEDLFTTDMKKLVMLNV